MCSMCVSVRCVGFHFTVVYLFVLAHALVLDCVACVFACVCIWMFCICFVCVCVCVCVCVRVYVSVRGDEPQLQTLSSLFACLLVLDDSCSETSGVCGCERVCEVVSGCVRDRE